MINWDAEDQQIALQEFLDMAELYSKFKGIKSEAMWAEIILVLIQEGMTRRKVFGLTEAEERVPMVVWKIFMLNSFL